MRIQIACGAILGLSTFEPGCHPAVSLGGNNAVPGGVGGSTTDVTEAISTTIPRVTGGSPNTPTTATTGTSANGSAPTSGGAASSSASVPLSNGGSSVLGGKTTTLSGGAGAASGTSAAASSAGSPGTASACLQLNEAECRLDQRCAAVPGPNARVAECAGDARGFSSCVSGGCRDVTLQCLKPEDMDLICSAACPSRQWAISPENGCPTCVCVDDVRIEPSMKGWDLASWLEADGWHFSLVPGTNRIKTCEEVRIHSSTTEAGTLHQLALPNLVAVKVALTRLAAGGTDQYVTVCGSNGCADIGCAMNRLPQATIDDLTRFAAALGMNLNTP